MESKAIALFMATREELEPFLSLCSSQWRWGVPLEGIGSPAPTIWHLRLDGVRVLACISGMGPQRAQWAAPAIVRSLKPCCLLSAGFCGGLAPELRSGEIVGLETLLDGVYAQPSLICLQAFYGAREACCQHLPAEQLFPITSGTALTTPQIVDTVRAKAKIRSTFGADIVDMELSSIASVAKEFSLPWGGVKVVSDPADRGMPLDFGPLLDDRGQVDRFQIAAALLRHPGALWGLCRLGYEAPRAARNLARFLAFYLPNLAYYL